MSPKSELTLDDDEFRNLIDFIRENYEPFKAGTKAFIPLDRPFDSHTADVVKGLFNHPEKRGLIDFIAKHEIIPEHLILALHHKRRMEAIEEFEQMLTNDLTEQPWQTWFQKNSWVLGTDFVRVLDERAIDTQHITDFLMQAYDGFLDIVEIKRPEGELRFWTEKLDHGNYVPSSGLTKAITQASRYLYEVEREANSVKFLERVDHVKTIKPRCILIFGRSNDWDAEQRESYRILNTSYHNLTVLTYDHVLDRARRLLRHDEKSQQMDRTNSEEHGRVEYAFIKIETFKSDAVVREPFKKKGNLETLSMLMLDLDYDEEEKVFDLDEVQYAAAIEKADWKVRFATDHLGKKMMAVFLDIYGNEARVLIDAVEFGKSTAKKKSRKKK